MLARKLTLVPIFILICTTTNAQKKDKVKLPHKWAAGISLGNISVSGDVTPIYSQLNIGAHLYKPITKWFGLRFNYNHGIAKGQNLNPAENFGKNTALNNKYSSPYRNTNGMLINAYYPNNVFTQTATNNLVYYNYKTAIHSFLLSGELKLPIPYSKPVIGLHLGVGIGYVFHNVKIDALNSDGNTYATLYRDIYNSQAVGNINKGAVYLALENGMDGVYETDAESTGKNSFGQSFSFGISFKLSNQMEIMLERKGIGTSNDLLDGQRWQESARGEPALTRDFDGLRYNTISFIYSF
jgi:hypothetical protein